MFELPERTGVVAILRDGRKFCGPIWEWRPVQGWFTLVVDPETYGLTPEQCPVVIFLRDCVSAIDYAQRTNRVTLEDVDLLERATDEGWNGQ